MEPCANFSRDTRLASFLSFSQKAGTSSPPDSEREAASVSSGEISPRESRHDVKAEKMIETSPNLTEQDGHQLSVGSSVTPPSTSEKVDPGEDLSAGGTEPTSRNQSGCSDVCTSALRQEATSPAPTQTPVALPIMGGSDSAPSTQAKEPDLGSRDGSPSGNTTDQDSRSGSLSTSLSASLSASTDSTTDLVNENMSDSVKSVLKEKRARRRSRKSVTLTPVALENEWVFYFDEKQAKGMKTEQYENAMTTVGSFNSVQGFWRYWNNFVDTKSFPEHCNLRLFKSGIKPLWEHPANERGGKFVLQPTKDQTNRVWGQVVLSMIGEQFQFSNDLCGAVLSIRPKRDIISLWNRDCEEAVHITATLNQVKRLLEMSNISLTPTYTPHSGAMQHNKFLCSRGPRTSRNKKSKLSAPSSYADINDAVAQAQNRAVTRRLSTGPLSCSSSDVDDSEDVSECTSRAESSSLAAIAKDTSHKRSASYSSNPLIDQSWKQAPSVRSHARQKSLQENTLPVEVKTPKRNKDLPPLMKVQAGASLLNNRRASKPPRMPPPLTAAATPPQVTLTAAPIPAPRTPPRTNSPPCKASPAPQPSKAFPPPQSVSFGGLPMHIVLLLGAVLLLLLLGALAASSLRVVA